MNRETPITQRNREESPRIESEKVCKQLREELQEYSLWNRKSDGWIDENYNNERKDGLSKNKYRRAWFAGIHGKLQIAIRKIEGGDVYERMTALQDKIMEVITNQYAREKDLGIELTGSLEVLCSNQEKIKSMLPENTDKKHIDLFITSLVDNAGFFVGKLKKDVTGQTVKRLLYGGIGESLVDKVFGKWSITKKYIGNIVIDQKEPNNTFVTFLQDIAEELNIKGKKKEFGTTDEEIDLVEKQLEELIATL